MESFKEFLFSPNEERNVALVVENQEIWVSKEILSASSPVFKKIFYGDFKERNEKSVELPGKTVGNIVEMLSCLFTGYSEPKQIDGKNVTIVGQLADEYDVKLLKLRCEEFLINKVRKCVKLNEVWSILDIAAKYRYKDAVKICIPRIATTATDEVMRRQKELDLAPFVISAILEAKSNRLDTIVKSKHDGTIDSSCYCNCGLNLYQCSKCKLFMCFCCKNYNQCCPSFHANDCKNRNAHTVKVDCTCGCFFNDSWLLPFNSD